MALRLLINNYSHIFNMCLRHTRLQNAVYLIHFYFLTKCAVRLVLFFYFSQNVAVFTIIFSIVFLFFSFQASESSGLAATQSHAMPHFEAAVWHSPVHNNQDVFEVRLPALSILFFLLMIYHLSSSFCCLALLCQFWSPAILWNFMVTSYSIYGAFSRKFSRIFRLLCYSS